MSSARSVSCSTPTALTVSIQTWVLKLLRLSLRGRITISRTRRKLITQWGVCSLISDQFDHLSQPLATPLCALLCRTYSAGKAHSHRETEPRDKSGHYRVPKQTRHVRAYRLAARLEAVSRSSRRIAARLLHHLSSLNWTPKSSGTPLSHSVQLRVLHASPHPTEPVSRRTNGPSVRFSGDLFRESGGRSTVQQSTLNTVGNSQREHRLYNIEDEEDSNLFGHSIYGWRQPIDVHY